MQAKTRLSAGQVKGGKGAFAYNAGTGEYGDMIDASILDPAKVTRLALQNAASVAGLLLTTQVMIAEAPMDDEHVHGDGAPGRNGRDGYVRSRKARYFQMLSV